MSDSSIEIDAFTIVRVDDWEELSAAFDRFASARGTANRTSERIVYRSGGAAFAVTRDGHVDAGMPLHEFSVANVDRLYFDPDGGRLLVRGPGALEYVFRRP
jgi:hypothetical protein